MIVDDRERNDHVDHQMDQSDLYAVIMEWARTISMLIMAEGSWWWTTTIIVTRLSIMIEEPSIIIMIWIMRGHLIVMHHVTLHGFIMHWSGSSLRSTRPSFKHMLWSIVKPAAAATGMRTSRTLLSSLTKIVFTNKISHLLFTKPKITISWGKGSTTTSTTHLRLLLLSPLRTLKWTSSWSREMIHHWTWTSGASGALRSREMVLRSISPKALSWSQICRRWT